MYIYVYIYIYIYPIPSHTIPPHLQHLGASAVEQLKC